MNAMVLFKILLILSNVNEVIILYSFYGLNEIILWKKMSVLDTILIHNHFVFLVTI